MSKYKTQGMLKTFKNAQRGFFLVIKSERNIKIHLVIAVLVLFLGWVLKFDAVRFCILIFVINSVIVTEMLNSGIEFGLDSVFHNKYSKMVGIAKDISASAVMFSSVMAVVVGILLFGEGILKFLK